MHVKSGDLRAIGYDEAAQILEIEFRQRDIKNISRFFVKGGLTVENPSDMMARMIN